MNALLEQILTLAIDNLKDNHAELSDFDSGRMMAYYEVLSLAKQQADLLGLEFEDQQLNQLDPEQLLKAHQQAA